MHRSELPSIGDIILPEEDRYLQVSEEHFIGPSGEFDDLINHSCNPNTGVMVKDRKAELYALRNIKIGEEVSYDYSLLMYDEEWTMECACGAPNCRKIIKEFRYLPLETKQKYHSLGLVPTYNLNFISKQ